MCLILDTGANNNSFALCGESSELASFEMIPLNVNAFRFVLVSKSSEYKHNQYSTLIYFQSAYLIIARLFGWVEAISFSLWSAYLNILLSFRYNKNTNMNRLKWLSSSMGHAH